ncbi:MAG: leucine--tRNA ligase [Candidatus Levyibacteriota bacterium]
MSNNVAKSAKPQKSSFDPTTIELKWQSKWGSEDVYQPVLDSAKPQLASGTTIAEAKKQNKIEKDRHLIKGSAFYDLTMFPYPSAEGLHVGFSYTSSGIDAYARFERMLGHEVFEPIGLDGFGIHSENHAIKTGSHPIEHAERTEKNFYRQLHVTGNSYAWKNKLETYDPEYYRWTQWLFVQLFKSGLAYKKNSPVNFCPSCKTVLSDEQVIDGRCERCESVVEKRDLEQWFFKITDYAGKLLSNIESLDWSEKVKLAQKNWIGKKSGINITYKVAGVDETVTIFTTRPDTNFGATFIALAPEHQLVEKIISGVVKIDAQIVRKMQAYVAKATNKSEIERQAEGKEKSGVFTGLYATNPLTDYQMPIWVSDFVLGGFGTGALVGVPGHDKRDFEFATKFGLEIIRVVVGKDGDASPIAKIEQVQEDEGTMINSGFLNGMDIHKATEKIMDHIEKEGYGKREVAYHLRDWLISRQRYWGPPIPMIYCEACAERGDSWFMTEEGKNHFKNGEWRVKNRDMAGWYPEEVLPMKLPYIKNFKPMGTGKAPLANHPEFYETTCPHCGGKATRETDVSDTFLDSSWYFLRYLATDLKHIPFPMSKEKAKTFPGATPEEIEHADKRRTWFPVTMYIGGAEHSVLHLLYARFVTMALKDMGYVDFEEPFTRFYAHGLIIKDGAKMSKSRGNVINPDDYIRKYGSDTLRTYLLFLGPFDQGGDFRDTGIEGMYRFVKKVWKLFSGMENGEWRMESSTEGLRFMHQTVKGVTEDLEYLRFNTAIAKLMTWYNFLAKQPSLSQEEVETYLKLFAPFAPHMTEELYQVLKNKEWRIEKKEKDFHSIHMSAWPTYDEKFLTQVTVTVAVQINGKLRGTVVVDAKDKEDKALIEKLAREQESVSKFLAGDIKHVIFVPGKILNFVVR